MGDCDLSNVWFICLVFGCFHECLVVFYYELKQSVFFRMFVPLLSLVPDFYVQCLVVLFSVRLISPACWYLVLSVSVNTIRGILDRNLVRVLSLVSVFFLQCFIYLFSVRLFSMVSGWFL